MKPKLSFVSPLVNAMWAGSRSVDFRVTDEICPEVWDRQEAGNLGAGTRVLRALSMFIEPSLRGPRLMCA